MTDTTVGVGRSATPPPPNVGSSTLGRALRLDTNPRITGRLHILGVVAPDLFELLTDAAGPLFPAVPGLAEETVAAVPWRCVVVDEDALSHGAWSGVLEDHASDLRAELVRFLEKACATNRPVYWLRRRTPYERSAGADAGDSLWTPEDPGLPGVPCPRAILVTPGSPMAEGAEEGARPSAVVGVLREALDASLGGA